VIFACAGTYGLFVFPLYALSVAHTNDHVAPEDYVETSSTLLLLYAVGAVFGPMIASAAMTALGAPGLFAFNAACLAAMAGFAIWRMRRRERPAEEMRAHFADSIRLAQTVGPVEPLSEDLGTADEVTPPAADDLPPANAAS
ncbi:MAG: hypothetical protein JSU82_03930, partial [Rhodospirillales bacterium]